MLSGILTSIITARSLGPDGRGEFVWYSSFALTVANFSYLGLPSSNTYLIVRKEGQIEDILINSTWISLFAGIIGTIIFLITGEKSILIIYLCLQIPSIMLTNFIGNILISMNRIKEYNYLDGSASIIIILFYAFCSYLQLKAIHFLFANLLGSVVATIFGFRLLIINSIEIKKYSFNVSLFRKSVSYAIKVYLSTFSAFLILRGSIFMLDYFHDKGQIGYYSIALQLYEALLIIPATIGTLLFPYLIGVSDKWLKTNDILKQTALIMGIICLLVYFLISPVVLMLFSAKFYDSILIIHTLLPGAFFMSLTGVISQFLASTGYPKLQAIIWVFSLFVWLIGGVFLIKEYAGVGAGISISIVNILLFIMLYTLAYRRHHFIPKKI